MEFITNLSGPPLYITIFFAKMLQVTIFTLRTLYAGRGEKVKSTILSFIATVILLVVVNTVITDLAEDPFKMVAYAAGFSLGNYLGVFLESRLADGLASIHVVSDQEKGDELADVLRDHGFGVSEVEGEGKDESKKKLLLIELKRNKTKTALKVIKKTDPGAYIAINEIKSTFGGYIK